MQEALSQSGDSLSYFRFLTQFHFYTENLDSAILDYEMVSKTDTTSLPPIDFYSFTGRDQEAYLGAKRAIQLYKKTGRIPFQYSHRIGYAYWKMSKKKEAMNYFNEQIKIGEEMIRGGSLMSTMKTAQYDLAGTYAFLGDKGKAYYYLDDVNTLKVIPLMLMIYIKHDPLFDNIRNEERFQKILHDKKSKYQAEHERVAKWLEEQGVLLKE